MRAILAAAIVATLPAAAAAASDTSMRCDGGIVSLGDATIDLLGKCGAPVLREPLVDATNVALRLGFYPMRRAIFVTSERWTYDFGTQRFLMFVTVDAGKIVAFDRGSYGYGKLPAPPVTVERAGCEPAAIQVGASKVDVISRCGEPVLVDVRPFVELFPSDVHRGVVGWRPVQSRDVEVWTYDFGPQQLIRFVYFESGVVRQIETGTHGYAR